MHSTSSRFPPSRIDRAPGPTSYAGKPIDAKGSGKTSGVSTTERRSKRVAKKSKAATTFGKASRHNSHWKWIKDGAKQEGRHAGGKKKAKRGLDSRSSKATKNGRSQQENKRKGVKPLRRPPNRKALFARKPVDVDKFIATHSHIGTSFHGSFGAKCRPSSRNGTFSSASRSFPWKLPHARNPGPSAYGDVGSSWSSKKQGNKLKAWMNKLRRSGSRPIDQAMAKQLTKMKTKAPLAKHIRKMRQVSSSPSFAAPGLGGTSARFPSAKGTYLPGPGHYGDVDSMYKSSSVRDENGDERERVIAAEGDVVADQENASPIPRPQSASVLKGMPYFDFEHLQHRRRPGTALTKRRSGAASLTVSGIRSLKKKSSTFGVAERGSLLEYQRRWGIGVGGDASPGPAMYAVPAKGVISLSGSYSSNAVIQAQERKRLKRLLAGTGRNTEEVEERIRIVRNRVSSANDNTPNLKDLSSTSVNQLMRRQRPTSAPASPKRVKSCDLHSIGETPTRSKHIRPKSSSRTPAMQLQVQVPEQKSFSTLCRTKQKPEAGSKMVAAPGEMARKPSQSSMESGGDEYDDDEFEAIMNATPTVRPNSSSPKVREYADDFEALPVPVPVPVPETKIDNI